MISTIWIVQCQQGFPAGSISRPIERSDPFFFFFVALSIWNCAVALRYRWGSICLASIKPRFKWAVVAAGTGGVLDCHWLWMLPRLARLSGSRHKWTVNRAPLVDTAWLGRSLGRGVAELRRRWTCTGENAGSNPYSDLLFRTWSGRIAQALDLHWRKRLFESQFGFF